MHTSRAHLISFNTSSYNQRTRGSQETRETLRRLSSMRRTRKSSYFQCRCGFLTFEDPNIDDSKRSVGHGMQGVRAKTVDGSSRSVTPFACDEMSSDQRGLFTP